MMTINLYNVNYHFVTYSRKEDLFEKENRVRLEFHRHTEVAGSFNYNKQIFNKKIEQ